MSDSGEIIINLGRKVESRLAKATDIKTNKADVRAIFEHHGPRLAAIALEKAEEMMTSESPEDFFKGMDVIKTFAPKMYASKDTDKKVEETAKSNVSNEMASRMMDIIDNQNRILKLGDARQVEIREVKGE